MKSLLLYLLASFVAFTPVVGAEDPKWIAFPAGMSHALVEKDGKLSARIPLSGVTGSDRLEKVQSKLRDLLSVEGRPQSLAGQLKVTLDPGTNDPEKPESHSWPSLLLVSEKPEDLLPGNYTLIVEFVSTDPSLNKTPQSATFNLQRAAPQLTSLRPVRIVQERGLLGDISNAGGRLFLREDSRKASVSGITVFEVPNYPANLLPETGRLCVDETTLTPISAGEDREGEVVPLCKFPIGKSEGKLHVRSPQLASPLTVDYEVIAVRTSAWIAICAIGGAIIGWLVRIYLQGRLDRLRALLSASEVLSAFIKAKSTVPDADFAKAIEDAENALKAGTGAGKTPAEIKTAVTKAQSDLAAAETGLNRRRQILDEALMPLRKLLLRNWHLPPAATSELNAARALVSGIYDLASSQNIRDAQARMDHDMAQARVLLANACGKWRVDATKYLDELATHPPALPGGGPARLTEAVAVWKKQFAEAYATVTDIEHAELEKGLAATHAALQQARTIAEDLNAGGEEISKWVRDLFPADADAFGALESMVKAHGGALFANLDEPGSARAEPGVRQREQKVTWEKTLRSLIPDADFTTVKAALDSGDWITAAQNAHGLRSAPNGADAGGTVLGRHRPSGDSLSAAPVAGGISFHTFAADSYGPVESLRTAPELSGTAGERIELSQQERFAAFVQTAIISGIFIALAYGFYHGQWTGTFREMLGVFAWAFGLDITAEAMAPFIKKAGTPPAGT